jgi:hypothetical protein
MENMIAARGVPRPGDERGNVFTVLPEEKICRSAKVLHKKTTNKGCLFRILQK